MPYPIFNPLTGWQVPTGICGVGAAPLPLPSAADPDDFGDTGQGQRERHDRGQVSFQVVGVIHHRPAHQNPWQPDADLSARS